MSTSHRYERRTFDEAVELARTHFLDWARTNLAADEVAAFRSAVESPRLVLGGGTPSEDWVGVVGFVPLEREYYEVIVYEATPACGEPSPSTWVQVLVPRDRASDRCHIRWLRGPS